jgi:hypothetical protein
MAWPMPLVPPAIMIFLPVMDDPDAAFIVFSRIFSEFFYWGLRYSCVFLIADVRPIKAGRRSAKQGHTVRGWQETIQTSELTINRFWNHSSNRDSRHREKAGFEVLLVSRQIFFIYYGNYVRAHHLTPLG